MARQLRPYFPGAAFHVTARTAGGAPWFDAAMRDFICECVATVQRRSDVKLLAFAIMVNHVHFVVQQGNQPLSRFMQPLLTRIAMAVRKKFDLEGHVFARRFWAHPCVTAEYLQTCIAYVHHNPIKAELCATAAEYQWSSARCYLGLAAFGGIKVEPLSLSFGDDLFIALNAGAHDLLAPRPTRSMEQLVAQTIRRFLGPFDVDIDIDALRALRGRTAAMIRRECIRQAARAGYRNYQIAKFLCISQSLVSSEVTKIRLNGLVQPAFVHESNLDG